MALDIQAYIGASGLFPSGDTTTHTISGIVDRDGQAFTPKVVILFSGAGNDWINTGSSQGFTTFLGFDTGTTAVSVAQTSSWQFGGNFNTYGGRNTYSSVAVAPLFVLHPIVEGKITELGSGYFKYKLNLSQADWAFAFVALGGADLECAVGYQDISGTPTSTIPTTFTCRGGIIGLAGGIGDAVLSGVFPAVTFLGHDLTQVSSSTGVGGSATLEAQRYQRTNAGVVITGSTGAGSTACTVTSLSPVTISRVSAQAVIYLLLNVPCHVGSLLQPASDGDVPVAISNFAPILTLFASTGTAAATTTQSGFNYSFGAATPTTQRATWFGAKAGATTAGNGGQGASWTDQSLFMATPNGLASSDSLTNGQIDHVHFSNSGFRTTWSESDGTQRQALYFAIGDDDPVNPGTALPMRCQRRFGHVNQSGKMLFLSNFQIDMQTGVGTSDAPDPQVMLRISKDGGHTWGPIMTRSAGRMGQYTRRVRWAGALGRARDWAFEVTCSDPVVLGFMQAWVDVQEGTS